MARASRLHREGRGFESLSAHQDMDVKNLLKELPSPFYRVSVKAIILDHQNRLLIGKGDSGEIVGWEVPGGGWEHGESIESCLKRELREELGARLESVGDILFVYRGRSNHGWMITRLAFPVKLKNFDFRYGDMTESKFVTKDELQQIEFDAEEGTIKDYANKIWPKS